MNRFLASLILASLIAGCASDAHRAPVLARNAAPSANPEKPQDASVKPRVHVVQKGDTLYGIAFSYGVDQHELAELNNIKDPNQIRVGQQIKLPSETTPSENAEAPPAHAFVKDQPRVVKYAYSEAAVAKAEAVQGEPSKTETKPEAKPEAKAEPGISKPDAKVEAKPDTATGEAIDWGMPTEGKLISTFSEAANQKGIDIAGKLGQPIYASAAGKVVYSGSGLRGYGKLLIIKHNKTYLSAYAHNDKLLVKEGETVKKGQKIAEMGKTDSDRVELHFEVRRMGKPVDPANYLPLSKP